MTGTEMATLARLDLRPIILVLNNACYMMLEALDGPKTYYDLKSWDYVAFARALGCEGERVTTQEQLTGALRRAEDATAPYLIEAKIDKSDRSPLMRRIQKYFSGRKKPAGNQLEEKGVRPSQPDDPSDKKRTRSAIDLVKAPAYIGSSEFSPNDS